MPLLKRKRVDPVAPPPYDASDKESRESMVWYSPLTKEIFKDYSEYSKRVQLYKKRIWQCEATGKSNLTYYEALESEKMEKEKVQDKLPEQLQKAVLLHIQFQTARLDAVVDNAYQHFVSRYVEGELLHYTGNDKKRHTVKVLEANVEPEDQNLDTPKTEYYKVQFMIKNTDIADKKKGIKVVPGNRLKRERFAFSKNYLKKFIKEYTTKDTYIGAPWIVSDLAAERLGIETKLPRYLQEAKDVAYAKSRKKRSEAVAIAAAAIAEAEGSDDSKPLMIDARKIESTLKYPMEDLNVPAYRRNPSGAGFITDMTPGTSGANSDVQNPTGDLPLCPQPSQQSTIPADCFGSFLMVWSFLSVFSQPLKLSPFTVDDFENALRYNSHCTIITESNVALLNAIIKQRERLKKESWGHGSMAREAAMSLFGTGYQASRTTLPLPPHHLVQQDTGIGEDDDDENVWKARVQTKRRVSTIERGCGSLEVENVGFNWDHGTVDTEEERVGWEDIMIGFINQLAPIEWIDDIDRILSHLVPNSSCTLEEREEAYISLSLRDKIKIFELLISVANESFVIKSFMFECQDQMTELRKQKIDLSRDRKRILSERQELEEKTSESHANTPELHESDSSDGEDTNASDDEDKNLLKAQRQMAHNNRRQESRQEILKRRQQEREEREAKRLKLHHLQREEARNKSKETKKRNDLRKRLDEEERVLHKKEEQIERDLRKYNNHRIKPLGRDKFYNRYYYLDDIGGTLFHGSGRLYIQSPSDTDIMILMERDSIESIDKSESLPCGRGGGVRFVSQLLEAQGLTKEAEFFNNRVQKLRNGETAPEEWWQSYDEPEDLEALIEWLNPKGFREFRLKRELRKQHQNLVNGMKKRVSDQNSLNKLEATRRNTRSKAIASFPPGSWLAYTNKLADN